MENNREFNIFYQYNTEEEIVNKNINSEYLLIIYERQEDKNFDGQDLIKELCKDGVDFNKIQQIFIKIDEEIEIFILDNFKNYQNENNIYLHFVIDENYFEKEINKQTEIFSHKISKLEEDYNRLSKDLKYKMNCSFLYNFDITKLIKLIEDEKDIELPSLDINLEKKEKSEISYLYLYCSILDLYDVDNEEENEHFNQMQSICKIFQQTSNISACLNFQPLIKFYNKYDNCFENDNIPDILHIDINPEYLDKKLKHNNLETIYESCSEILKIIKNQKNINKIKLIITNIEYFNTKETNIIYLSSDNKAEEYECYKTFYKKLLNGFTLNESYEQAVGINNNIISEKIIINDYSFFPRSNNINKNCFNNNIRIAKNCILNPDFLKYNYNRILGRNEKINNCITKIKEQRKSVLIYGLPGAGKKIFMKTVGKYFYEKKYFKDILFIEIYHIKDIENILKNKIEQIEDKYYSNENNYIIASELKNKILLIINFNFVLIKKDNFKYIENLMNNKIKNKNIIFLYACTLERDFIEKNELDTLDMESIKLDKITDKNSIENGLKYIENNLSIKINIPDKKLKALIKNGYPNFILLKCLYFKEFDLKKKTAYDDEEELLLKEYLEKIQIKKEINIDKILSIFYILKLGLRKDILDLFFTSDEIKIIKGQLNYIITSEVDSKGKYYFMDTYFYSKIKKYLNKYLNDKNKLNSYIKIILSNYAYIFRYLVNNSKVLYEIYKEFHAGINQGLWSNIYNSSFNEEYNEIIKQIKEKKIFFDEERYYYNIIYIFDCDKFFSIIEDNKEEYKEYISQIIICFATMLYFTKNKFLFNKIEILQKILRKWDEYVDIFRFKIFKYWCKLEVLKEYELFDISQEQIPLKYQKDTRLYKFMKFELNMFKLYKRYKTKLENNKEITFEELEKYADNNKYNLIRLNLLYGIVNKHQYILYFNEAKRLSDDINDDILKIISLIELVNYYLMKKNLNDADFESIDKYIIECESIIKKIDDNIFDKRILKLKEDKDERYKKYKENDYFFYVSEPFFDDDEGIQLKTELNNSFFLKYNIISKNQENININFEFIHEDFLDTLENKLKNPTKFIYIGSDYYDSNGNLYYSDDDFNAQYISLIDIEDKIKKLKNKSEIIILGFINSDIIANYFIENNFTNVIYIKSDDLIKFFDEYPYLYFFFQRCLFEFVISFVMNLKKINIKENFYNAKRVFTDKLNELTNIYAANNIIKNYIMRILGKQIIHLEYKYDENKKNNSIINAEINDIQIDNENIVFKSNKITELNSKIINNRYYGNKYTIKVILSSLKNNRIINLYGPKGFGKSTLCLELCKYYFMNNKFKDGIFYITNIEKINLIEDELNLLKNKKNENNNLNDALIIIDINNLSLSTLNNFLNDYHSYIIFTSIESFDIDENQEIKECKKKGHKKKKKNDNKISEDIKKMDHVYLNKNILGKNLDNYLDIINYINKNDA